MKRLTLAMLAGAALLTGCADGNPARHDAFADNGYTPTGTNIPRKAPSRADNVAHLDKQALENDQVMGNGTLNLPQK